MGTAEHNSPAVTARPSAVTVTGWLARTQMPTGTYSRADRLAAAAPTTVRSNPPATRCRTATTPADAYAKCMHPRIYTLQSWTWNDYGPGAAASALPGRDRGCG